MDHFMQSDIINVLTATMF